MTELSIEKIQLEFNEYRRRIDPAFSELSIQTKAEHNGTSHLELIDNTFHYITTERGLELNRKTTQDKEELLYWLVDEMAWSMANRYELKNRIKGQSFRRLLFAKNIEYLNKVNPAWAERKQKEFDAILTIHPYDDKAEG